MSDIPPADAKQTAAYKGARLAVIILSALIVLALIALILGGIFKLSHRAPATSAASPSHFTLAPGAHIVAMEAQPGRLILRIHAPAGDEIDIIDIEDGHLVGQIKSAAK